MSGSETPAFGVKIQKEFGVTFTIDEAIDLLKNSQIHKNNVNFKSIVRKIEYQYKMGYVVFYNGPAAGPAGERGNCRGTYIRLNLNYLRIVSVFELLPAMTLALLHEGAHFAYIKRVQIDDVSDLSMFHELNARRVTTHYFRELSHTGISMPSGLLVRLRSSFEDYGKFLEHLDKDQLLDLTILQPPYDSKEYINKQWIIETFDFWRGIDNRLPATKILYVLRLLDTEPPSLQDIDIGKRVLLILESIRSRSEWDAILNAIITLFRSLRPLHTCFKALSMNTGMASRVLQLQQKWSTPLTAEADAARTKLRQMRGG